MNRWLFVFLVGVRCVAGVSERIEPRHIIELEFT